MTVVRVKGSIRISFSLTDDLRGLEGKWDTQRCYTFVVFVIFTLPDEFGHEESSLEWVIFASK